MATKDCGICDLVINCGAVVDNKDQYQTAVIRLLCEFLEQLTTIGGRFDDYYTKEEVDALLEGPQ